ncbi:hypothetical protein CMUS01_13865 [Colletotrichum musicola]|uniref:Uncharacterized protein n=1 Tax=Colletotrichum musicola TaxID=2175873 RepID=A0A8H6J8Q2_9PEZI|nr:hypothetical protein CMUS01_13865 [Colletotrichum musicola]
MILNIVLWTFRHVKYMYQWKPRKEKEFRVLRDELRNWDYPLARLAPRPLALEPDDTFSTALGREFRNLVAEGIGMELRRCHEWPADDADLVWLSYSGSDGQLNWWSLITQDVEYVVCRSASNRDNRFWRLFTRDTSVLLWVLQGCEYHHPEVGNVDFLMVGWTVKTKQEVAEAFQTVVGGDHGLLWNSCHHLLRNFASSIVASMTPEWKFLHETTVRADKFEPITNPVQLAVQAWCRQGSLGAALASEQGQGSIPIIEENIRKCERFIAKMQKNYTNAALIQHRYTLRSKRQRSTRWHSASLTQERSSGATTAVDMSI